MFYWSYRYLPELRHLDSRKRKQVWIEFNLSRQERHRWISHILGLAIFVLMIAGIILGVVLDASSGGALIGMFSGIVLPIVCFHFLNLNIHRSALAQFIADHEVLAGRAPSDINSDAISFTGRLTLRDALDLNHYWGLCVVRGTIRLLVSVICFLLSALVIWAGSTTKFTPTLWIIVVILLAPPMIWFVISPLLVIYRYRSRPDLYIESTVTLSGDGFSVSNPHHDFRLKWAGLTSIVFTPRGILVLAGRPLCWLPQRLFAGNDYRDSIIQIAIEHSLAVRTIR